MTLREAAERTSRSVTTLRRYIRSGRLLAETRNGRYGPEYYVSEADLENAGFRLAAGVEVEPTPADGILVPSPMAVSPALPETVPLRLYQEMQMKHEQLLVQYGMVRVGGLRSLELRAELETREQELEQTRGEMAGLKNRLARGATRLVRRLREAELELESKRLEIGALKEKVRGLEMLTRNSVTNETIERQYAQVMQQARKVDQMTARQETSPGSSTEWPPPPRGSDTDH